MLMIVIMGGCIGTGEQYKEKNISTKGCRNSTDHRSNSTASLINQVLEVVQEKLHLKSLPEVERVFRASEHKFKASSFHQICKDRTNTILVVITATKKVYGGFTPCPWKKQEYLSYQSDSNCSSFLFALKGEELEIYDLKEEEKGHAIMNDEECGPVFGAGYDLYIKDECNVYKSWNNLSKSYHSREVYGSKKANCQLCEEETFLIRDYQLWTLKL